MPASTPIARGATAPSAASKPTSPLATSGAHTMPLSPAVPVSFASSPSQSSSAQHQNGRTSPQPSHIPQRIEFAPTYNAFWSAFTVSPFSTSPSADQSDYDTSTPRLVDPHQEGETTSPDLALRTLPEPPSFATWDDAREWCADNWTSVQRLDSASLQPELSELRFNPFTPAYGRYEYELGPDGKRDKSKGPKSRELRCPSHRKLRCGWRAMVFRRQNRTFTLKSAVKAHSKECNEEHAKRVSGQKRQRLRQRQKMGATEADSAVTANVACHMASIVSNSCEGRVATSFSSRSNVIANGSTTKQPITSVERRPTTPPASASQSHSPANRSPREEEDHANDVLCGPVMHGSHGSHGGDPVDGQDQYGTDRSDSDFDNSGDSHCDDHSPRPSTCTLLLSATAHQSDRANGDCGSVDAMDAHIAPSTPSRISPSGDGVESHRASTASFVEELYDFKPLWTQGRSHVTQRLPHLAAHDDWFLSKIEQRLASRPSYFATDKELEAMWPQDHGNGSTAEQRPSTTAADSRSSSYNIDDLSRRSIWMLPGDAFCQTLKDLRDYLGVCWLFVDFSEAITGPVLPPQRQGDKKLAALRGSEASKVSAATGSQSSAEARLFAWKAQYSMTVLEASTLRSIDLYAMIEDTEDGSFSGNLSAVDLTTLVLLR